jgi:thiol-disulfide isomerase/thioredoxin
MLGVSYAIVFIMASFYTSIKVNRLGNETGEAYRLGHQDKRSDRPGRQIFGCTGLSLVNSQTVRCQTPYTSAKEAAAPQQKKKVNYPANYLLIWTAKWCPKCPLMKTIGDRLKAEGFDVFYIDFDAYRQEAKEAKIAGIPVAIIYEDGEEVKRVIGVSKKTKKKVEAQIRKVLKKNTEEEEKEKEERAPDNYDIY